MKTIKEDFEDVQMIEPVPETRTQFHVYQNLHFISDLHFEKGQITIGSNHSADLFLDHQSVEGIHALVDIESGKAILTNQFPENGLRLNGEPVLKARLHPDDVIAIGPFALKIKKTGQIGTTTTDKEIFYSVRLVNRYNSAADRDIAAVGLSRLLNVNLEKTKNLVARDLFVIKKGASGLEAARIQNSMLKARVICDVQLEKNENTPPLSQSTLNRKPEELPGLQSTESLKEDLHPVETTAPFVQEDTLETFLVYEDDDEEEEELWEAPFCLEEELPLSLMLPQKESVKQPMMISWQHWLTSMGFHLAVFLVFFMYFAFQAGVPQKQELHFVKIDRSMLEQINLPKPKAKPPKKPTPEIKAQKPKKVAKPEKKKPIKRQSSPATKTAKKKKKVKNAVTRAKTNKDPKAGGGFGKGNIKNRNINQTGLLSVLGDDTPAVTSAAMAVAVSNLDAVKVPGATEKNFSVGGLIGALGDGKIVVASGAIVQTKGSAQVLRSAGAKGKGEVAALTRGNTGKKQVQAMVTAKMNRTVKIEGGMSRELVKKVIDQHLDEITYCYEMALMVTPSILGRVVFEWKILKSGRVGQVRIVSSNVNSSQIHDCIKSAIRSWQFPKPVGSEVIVSYPFVFDLVSF